MKRKKLVVEISCFPRTRLTFLYCCLQEENGCSWYYIVSLLYQQWREYRVVQYLERYLSPSVSLSRSKHSREYVSMYSLWASPRKPRPRLLNQGLQILLNLCGSCRPIISMSIGTSSLKKDWVFDVLWRFSGEPCRSCPSQIALLQPSLLTNGVSWRAEILRGYRWVRDLAVANRLGRQVQPFIPR